jgi:hypothetical protein
VRTENLGTGIVAMKSTRNGARPDHTGSMNWARNGRLLIQGQVRPRLIIIRSQNPAQMCLPRTMMWSTRSRRIDPISRSDAMGLSRMPMARSRRVTTAPRCGPGYRSVEPRSGFGCVWKDKEAFPILRLQMKAKRLIAGHRQPEACCTVKESRPLADGAKRPILNGSMGVVVVPVSINFAMTSGTREFSSGNNEFFMTQRHLIR